MKSSSTAVDENLKSQKTTQAHGMRSVGEVLKRRKGGYGGNVGGIINRMK
jgi:hypothetical protein